MNTNVNGLCSAAHNEGMKTSIWTVTPARLAPASLDPRPLKNSNSPGFPTTEADARIYVRKIKAGRANPVPRRTIAETMRISRIEAFRLAQSLDAVLEESREAAAAGPVPYDAPVQPEHPLPPSLPLRLIR